MDTNIESSEKAIPDQVVGIILVFCTSFMLSSWIAIQLEISLFFPIAVFTLLTVLTIVIYTILWSCKRPRRTLDPPLLPRQSSHDSGYTSQYGSTDTPKDRIEITNDEWSCQLHALKAQEKFLQNEVEVLNKRAREAYQKHFKVSQFFLEHDAQKMASFDTNSLGFDASRAWYAADLERTMKIKELQENQHRIKELRTEMQEHFWDVV
ncbi:hypothetical protein DL95DRAFT_461684 [Leptodontidium sp. 2 PMI_412]|nr:hypothetical protein DL95DRAFT_461684 [Leptodontidium sp. 2 PMI_412]